MDRQSFSPGTSVTVEVPASSANLGPGFDSIGLALGIYDTVEATIGGDDLVINVDGHGADDVPTDDGHLIWQSAVTMWRHLGIEPPQGVTLNCRNEIPHARGLGSSAAAIVAGLAVGLALVRDHIDDDASLALLNNLASDAEGHPDNASASVYGGFTISWADDQRGGWHTVRPPLHPQITPTLLVPHATLSTDKARAALGDTVTLSAAASTAGRAALLVEGMTRDPSVLYPATRDWLHQEARRPSYAQSMSLLDVLRSRGEAAAISGAGPAVLVLGTQAPALTAEDFGDTWQVLRPGIATTGVRVVSRSAPSTV
ncbi:homoserine kinase [Flexivirga sp. ID2601S]|uniref:Homoserine kinase n=1 Tax=Flexivirga aerilata TaxID=1656889 RepID=A0A849AHE7_9MICO|nr:homoserine kinase [Flexivirga aerilata]